MSIRQEGFRHENKFIISRAQKISIESAIQGVLQKDRYLLGDSYNIRSLYFDDYEHTCFYENVNGTDPREKFRIRIYNGKSEFIRLELKRKQNLMTQKLQCRMTKEQVDTVICGKPLQNFSALPPLLKKFELQRQCRLLHPDVITEYDRIPYTYSLGNVRITFDMNISGSMEFSNFFSSKMAKRPILMPDMLILEVKYDEFLPDYIEELIYTDTGQRTTFSKFYLCKYFLSRG